MLLNMLMPNVFRGALEFLINSYTIPIVAKEPKNKQPIINIVVLIAIVESGSLR